MVSMVPALALAGCTEVITGGTSSGGPWLVATTPGLPLGWLGGCPGAGSAAVHGRPLLPAGAGARPPTSPDPPAGARHGAGAPRGPAGPPWGGDPLTPRVGG